MSPGKFCSGKINAVQTRELEKLSISYNETTFDQIIMRRIVAELHVNGQWETYPEPVYVQNILTQHKLSAQGVAIAVNGTVYPRSSWDTPLTNGATIDIVTAVQGG